MQDKLKEIFDLTKVTLDEKCEAIHNSRDIYKDRLETIKDIIKPSVDYSKQKGLDFKC